MSRVLLVRHGQASFGAEDYDVLSDVGFEQSRLLGEQLKQRDVVADVLVGGVMRRHRETAEACAEAAGWSASLQVDPGWDEFDFLAVLAAHPAEAPSGDDPAEFQRWFEVATASWIAGDDLDYPETFAAFGARVQAALDRAAAGSGTTVVVTSGGPIAWATALVLAEPEARPALWNRLNRVAVNTGCTLLTAGSRGINLLTYNEHGHLSGDLITYR